MAILRSFEIVEIVFAPVEKIDNERAAAEYCVVGQLNPRFRHRRLPCPPRKVSLPLEWSRARTAPGRNVGLPARAISLCRHSPIFTVAPGPEFWCSLA